MRRHGASGFASVLAAVGCLLVSACSGSAAQPSASVPPTVSNIMPATGPVGTEVTIVGSGFPGRDNTVRFGTGYIRNIESADGTTLRFAIPDGLDLCAPESAGPCPGAYPQVTPGDYAVGVLAAGETSNTLTFTVTPE